jgi:hypothetical protein
MANPEHKDTLDCAKRDGGPLYGPDGIEPVGFTGKPCKCKLWRQIYQHEDTATAGPPRLIEGCRFDLELYIQATILRKCNHAAKMAIEANKTSQELRRDIGTLVLACLPPNLRHVVEMGRTGEMDLRGQVQAAPAGELPSPPPEG